jgi:hypothetical protein
MPEGLSPIEVGKQLHEHTSQPHEHDASASGNRHSRTVQIGEALLLSWGCPGLTDRADRAVRLPEQ